MASLVFVGCASNPGVAPRKIDDEESFEKTDPTRAENRVTVSLKSEDQSPEQAADNESYSRNAVPARFENDITEIGTGKFFNSDVASEPASPTIIRSGKVNLQFNDTKISEVVRTVFGELLDKTYIISPEVKGTVTFSTAKPIAKSQLKYLLETILSWNNAALVLREDIYHVVPRKSAVTGQLSPNLGSLPEGPGYEVLVVPLDYISASEMEKLLEPFLDEDALLHTDDKRQLLVLGGTPSQLKNYLRTVSVFDVNWLDGMSVGVFPLEVAKPSVMIDELKLLFGFDDARNSVNEQIRFMPMERLNAVVVITSQREYLRRAQEWTNRLDRQVGKSAGQQLFVYKARNMNATELSGILSTLFSGQDGFATTSSNSNVRDTVRGQVAPGLTPVRVDESGVTNTTRQVASAPIIRRRSDDTERGELPASFTAVEQNNALLIKATPTQYRGILEAIKQLDTPPLQVLIEATILEVTLSDGLSYGVEWFLNNAAEDFLASDNDPSDSGFGRIGSQGISYLIGRQNVGVAVSALRNSGKTKLLSSPSLWALNNQAASINVGTQIPVNVTSINLDGDTDAVTSEVQFRDTGVILEVTPRIHPGGVVFLDVILNISNPVGNPDSNGNVSVAQRALETNIAVKGGESVLLGGLISERKNEGSNGVPWLSDVPVIGGLFGSNNNDSSRSEIIAIITPTVVDYEGGSAALLDEYQRSFEYIAPISQPDE